MDEDDVGNLCQEMLHDLDRVCSRLCDELATDANPTRALAAIVEVATSGALSYEAEERLVTEYMQHYVQILLARPFPTCPSSINEFFLFALDCIAGRLRNGDPCMLPTLYRIFDENRAFYLNDATGGISQFLAKNIDFWIEIGGFRAILCNIDPTFVQSNDDGPATDEDMEYQITQPFEFDAVICAFKCIAIVKEQLTQAFLEDFLPQLTQSIVHYVQALPMDLTMAQREDLSETLQLFEVITCTHPLLLSELKLEIAWKSFNCRNLEKRIHGLMDINETLSRLSMSSGSDGHAFAIQWLDKNQVLKELFGINMHAELLKRCGTIFEIYASCSGLSEQHIDVVWEVAMDGTKGRHEALLSTSLELLIDIISKLVAVPELMDYIFALLASLPQVDTPALLVLRGIAKNPYDQGNHDRVVWYIWRVMKNPSGPIEMDQCINVLNELLLQASWKSTMSDIVVDCFHTIKVRSSQPSSAVDAALLLLSQFSRLFSEGYRLNFEEKHRAELQPSCLTGLLNELSEYKTKVNSTQAGSEHLEQVKIRLLALHGSWLLVLLANHDARLSHQQLNTLWHNCITKATSTSEADLCFQWIQLCEQLLPDDETSLLDLDLKKYILSQFGLLKPQHITKDALECFQLLFQAVNVSLGSFHTIVESEEITRYLVAKPLEALEGLSHLWHLAIHVQDAAIVNECTTFLVGCHLDLVAEVDAAQSKRAFADTCIAHLLSATASIETKSMDANAFAIVNRCVELMRTFLQSCCLEKSPSPALAVLPSPAKPEVGAPKNGPQVTKRVILEAFTEFHAPSPLLGDDDYASRTASLQRIERPARVHPLSPDQMHNALLEKPIFASIDDTVVNNSPYFSALFRLLEWPETTERTWELLSCLPTNCAMMEKMVLLRDSVTTLVPWTQLLDIKNVHRLLYGLRIVEALLLPLDDASALENARRQWRERFVRLGGSLHLYNALLDWQFTTPPNRYQDTCLAALLRVLEYFLHFNDPLESSSFDQTLVNSSLPSFIQQVDFQRLLQIVVQIIVVSCSREELNEDAIGMVEAAFNLFRTLGKRHPQIIQNYFDKSKWLTWIKAISLDCPNQLMRQALCNSFLDSIDTEAQRNCLIPEACLLALSVQKAGCSEFMTLVASLLHRGLNSSVLSWLTDSNYVDQLVNHLKEYSSQEGIGTECDPVVYGCLAILKELVLGKAVVPSLELLEFIWNCLLYGDDSSSLRKLSCQVSTSRQMAHEVFFLVLAQGKLWPEAIHLLLSFQYRALQILDRIGRPWAFTPLDEVRDTSTYAGLYNPGCICYMNALLQQLFHMPTFRHCLLSSSINNPSNNAEQEVVELQRVFTALESTLQKSYDPSLFCVSHRDADGQPTDIRVQMDADEFFGMLLDRVETVLRKQSKDSNSLGFGGNLVNQIITETGHISEREEPFFVLSVDVHNKNSLQSSLSSYVQGETLEGDNAYYCELDKRKVRALKRVCLKNLPSTLVIHLKRFEFDFDTMEKVKLNDFLEFPVELDMYPYTSDCLGASVDGKVANNGQELYSLMGIVVHSGTSDTGHYYSFIKDRLSNTWHEFNDQIVRPFDPSQMSEECFGGDEIIERWDPLSRSYHQYVQTKRRSAYMLIYDKVDTRPRTPQPKAPSVQAILGGIESENNSFYSLLHAFEPTHVSFIAKVLKQIPTSAEPSFTLSSTNAFVLWEDIKKSGDTSSMSLILGASILFSMGTISPPSSSFEPLISTFLAMTTRPLGFAFWFLSQAVTELMQTKPGSICIGEYAQRRTWCFDVVHLCQNLELRSCFFDIARACIEDMTPSIVQSMTEHPDEWDTMPNATILITFLDECIALFYQRDSIEVAGMTCNISTVIANAPLGASVQILGSFLDAIVTESALVRYLLVEKCHVVYHFVASLTIDAVDAPVACTATTPEQYAAMQTAARVATFPTEKSLLATLLGNPKSCLIDESYPLSLPPQDIELLLDSHRLCCIFACGFDTFLAQSLKCIAPEEPEASRLAIKALLSLLDTVKATTLLEPMFELLNAVLFVDDSYRGVRVDALFSADQGILALAFYYRHHRSLQHYTYYLLDYLLTSATEIAEVAAYLLRPDVKEQASWVRAWLWNFLQSNATIGDLNHEELDGESQLVLEVVEQLFGSKSELENQVDQILLETHDIKTTSNNKPIAFSDIKVDLVDDVNPAELLS